MYDDDEWNKCSKEYEREPVDYQILGFKFLVFFLGLTVLAVFIAAIFKI